MSRIGIWIANAVLLTLGCYLGASIVNELAAEWLGEGPGTLAAVAPAVPAPERTWQDRQVILSRNLFNVSTLQPAGPAPTEEEDLEATKLPLALRGTVASSNPQLAWAAVEDTEKRRNLVVRVNDRLLERATVVRIERRRIVLQHGERREELALAEDETPSASRPSQARRAPSRARRSARAEPEKMQERVRRLAENRFAVPRGEVEGATRNPSALFSQARILPKYEAGQMVGVQLNAIQPGSLFEEIGIEDGDVITELNGIEIASPQDSARVLRELTEADQFTLIVHGADGGERTLNYEVAD